MPNHSKFSLAALTAAVVLATAVGAASARRFVVDEQNFQVTWVRLVFSGGLTPIKCAVTLEGSFHSQTIEKVIGSLLGFITRATLNNAACEGGGATILTTNLPWHITYEGFTGRLPDITEVHILLIRMEVRLEQLGANCLLRTSTTEPAEFWIPIIREGSRLRISGLIPNSARRIRCAGSLEFNSSLSREGASTLTRPNSPTFIVVRLI